ncbi:MAG: helix-turn-helix transcriptional regulator [Prevotellaceae bacterium]|jgi:AraC-like DNA-binding protein|nr:helix-turn-helix transcriptional regulator [Prevotellaceae bacterium]
MITGQKQYPRLIDCTSCPKASDGVMMYYQRAKGFHTPADKCSQNCILFIIQGELLINSEEYPGVKLRAGEFVLQAIGSKLEMLAVADVEYVFYWFNDLPKICEERYRSILEYSDSPLTYTPLVAIPRLRYLLADTALYLEEQRKPCGEYIQLKVQEIVYILLCYYPAQQLSVFFYPISRYTQSFHFFIMQNYEKVKTVEEFAHLGGYTTTTFRRIFRNVYGKPVYEWILSKKREGILHDLQYTNQRITEICNRYGFDSLSHFAHFCKASFGDTPRALRTRAIKGERIQSLVE